MSSPSPSTSPNLKPDGRTRVNSSGSVTQSSSDGYPVYPSVSASAEEQQRDKDLQSLTQDALVVLYQLDLRPIGVSGTDAILRFCPTTEKDANGNDINVRYDGQDYYYAGVDIAEIEWGSSGEQSNPKLFVPFGAGKPEDGITGSSFATRLIRKYQDLVGARLTRIRIFEKFLDRGSLPDPNAILSRDVFVVEQKETMTNEVVEFILKPIYDVGKRHLPGRQAIKRTCSHRYRVWNGSTFDYTLATCPYNGTNYFKKNGDTTSDGGEDVCSRDLKGCKLRFGDNGVLPTRAFPGMSRISGY